MERVEDSADRLVLRGRVHLWSGRGARHLLIALAFLLLGMLLICVWGRTNSLHCVRTGPRQVACDVATKVLGLVPLGQRRVDRVHRVLATFRIVSGDGAWIVELMAEGASLVLVDGPEPSCRRFAQRMNEFIASAQTTADFRWGFSAGTLVTLPILVLLAVAALAFLRDLFPYTVTIDHAHGVLQCRRSGFPARTYRLELIEDIEVRERQADEDRGEHLRQEVFLRSTRGQRIPLDLAPAFAPLVRAHLRRDRPRPGPQPGSGPN